MKSPSATARPHPFGLTLLFGALYVIQGVTEPTDGLIAQPVLSLLKEWGQSAEQISIFAALWAAKPLYGLISDFVPLARYHRKSYLIAASAVAAASLAWLALRPPPEGSASLLLAMLLPATIGVAFSDVVIDALMIEKGQPHGWTGRFQAVQWAALYGSTILVGWLGGYLIQTDHRPWAFMICAGLSCSCVVLAGAFIREQPAGSPGRDLAGTLGLLRHALGTPTILASAAFLFLWNFNPFSSAVLYLYMTESLEFSEVFYGQTRSIEAVGLAAGSLLYALYCRKVPMRILIHVAIVLGVVSSLAYWCLFDRISARMIAVGVGLATATATMVQLDLAAQLCPPQVAGTLFALLMGVSNLGIALATWVGGWCYQRGVEAWGPSISFNVLVGLGALCTAACWLVAPALVRATRPPGSTVA